MGIEMHVEVKGRQYLPLAGDRTDSKALATLFLEPLLNYCFHRAADITTHQEEWLEEVVQWFANLTASMREDLCLIGHAIYGGWEYSADDYEQYVSDSAYEDPSHLLSRERFLQECQATEQKWTDTDALGRVADDLIRVIDEIHPRETWWYNEEDTLPDLRLLSQTLKAALKMGYEQVRLHCF